MKINFITKEILLVLLFTFVSVLIRGYEYGLGNQIHYLTYVNYRLNPSLYPFDYLLKTHTIPYSVYIDTLKYLPQIGGSQQIPIFILYFTLLFIFYLSIYHITKHIFHDTKIVWLVMLFMVYPLPVAGSTITTVEKSLTPRFIGEVFLMLPLYLILLRRYFYSAAIAAVGLLFHPLTLLPYPLILIILFFLRDLPLKKLLLTSLIFVILPLPLIGKFLVNESHSRLFLDAAWKSVLLERTPYMYIHTWAYYDFILLSVLPLFFTARYLAQKKSLNLHPLAIACLLSGLILFIFGLVSDVLSFQFGLQMQLSRNLFLPIIFFLLYFAAFVVERIKIISYPVLILLVAIAVIALSLFNRISDGILWVRPLTDFEKTAVWARNNSNINSIFLVPPSSDGFRFWSQRSVVNESKEGGDSIFNRSFALEWDRREDLLEKYSDLNRVQVSLLQNEFHINYIVTPKTLPYGLVYKSGDWNVYKI